MRIQGMNLKKGKQVEKGKLYEFKTSISIPFLEDDTNDYVDIVFELDKGDRALYGTEYRPETVAKEGAKVIDITASKINDDNKTIIYYLLDVKKDVGGEDVIYKLCEQWQASLQYFSFSIIGYLDDYDVDRTIGVITRNFDVNRVKDTIYKKQECIKQNEKMKRTLAGAKMRTNIPVLKKEIKLLLLFVEQKVVLRVSGNEELITFAVLQSTNDLNGKWYYQLKV